MTENYKLRKAILSAFYDILQRNFGILLILWCSFKLWWHFCLDLLSSKFWLIGEWSVDDAPHENQLMLMRLASWNKFLRYDTMQFRCSALTNWATETSCRAQATSLVYKRPELAEHLQLHFSQLFPVILISRYLRRSSTCTYTSTGQWQDGMIF
jgi:hypothetical protein